MSNITPTFDELKESKFIEQYRGKIVMKSWHQDRTSNGYDLWGVDINGHVTYHREFSRRDATDKAWTVFCWSQAIEEAGQN